MLRKIKYSTGLVLAFLLLSSSFVSAQQELKKKYEEAEVNINNNIYAQALPLFLYIDSVQGDNNSVKFQIGVCYLNSPLYQAKAIPYLIKAAADITGNYNPSSLKEKHAPYDALLDLAKAYHANYQFDTAIAYYNKFKALLDTAADKESIAEVNRDVQMCATGKQLMATPVKMDVTLLSDSVNSPYPDYCPVVTADESQLFFTSRRPIGPNDPKDESGQFFENVYMANSNNGQWGKAYNIGAPVNTIGKHSATVSISPDGQTIFIFRDDGDGDGNIYTTHLNGTQWSTPEKLNENIDSKYWEPSASVSADGQILYFTSNRPGGFGGRDLYMSRLLPNGQWGRAQNLGPKINTEFEEDAPFITPTGKRLYFSSTGHNTMGGFDIFYSDMDSNGQWGTPVNMGYPVNTPGDDIYFTPTTNGKGAYYSSFKETGLGEKDIYRINFPEKKEEALTVYRGTIVSAMDSTTPTIPQNVEIVVTDVATGEQVGVYHPNSATGKFLFILPSGKNYNITYQAEGYLFHSENLDVRDSTAYQVLDQAIDMRPLGVGEKIILRNVFFASGKADIRPESAPELQKVYDLMKMLPGISVEISGHTDAQGSDKINTPLSQARAESVVDYLVKMGIDKGRFVAKGYGPTVPVARNKNANGTWNRAGMALNRRIEFKIISTSIPIKVEQPPFVPDKLKPLDKNNKNK